VLVEQRVGISRGPQARADLVWREAGLLDPLADDVRQRRVLDRLLGPGGRRDRLGSKVEGNEQQTRAAGHGCDKALHANSPRAEGMRRQTWSLSNGASRHWRPAPTHPGDLEERRRRPREYASELAARRLAGKADSLVE